MRSLEYYWVDVFAENRMEGNQLAVFPGASDITDQEMQTIAREMNLSETTFITDKEKDLDGETAYHVRIFTTNEELPFAGHPTLGTAFVLRSLYGHQSVLLKEKVGNIPVTFSIRSGSEYGEMEQNNPVFGQLHNPQDISRIFQVSIDDLDTTLPIQTVSTGNPFAIVPFRKLGTLQSLKPNFAMMEDYLGKTDAKFMYAVTLETVSVEAILHARMIFYGGEDPATGSAAGPAAAWLLSNGIMPPDEEHHIEQGLEIKRSSRLYVSGSMKDGAPTNIKVGGHCFLIGKGEIEL